MVSIVDILLSPTMLIGIFFFVEIVEFGLLFYLRIKHEEIVCYFAEDERRGEDLKIIETTPRFLYTEGNKRFMRGLGGAWSFKSGRKTILRWLGKRGSALTWRLRQPEEFKLGEEQKYIKIGSLYEALEGLWGKEAISRIKEDLKQLLIESKIFVTVDLEPTKYKEGTTKEISEEDANSEANQRMANLIGINIIKEMKKEDRIKLIALVCTGGFIVFLLFAIGILHWGA